MSGAEKDTKIARWLRRTRAIRAAAIVHVGWGRDRQTGGKLSPAEHWEQRGGDEAACNKAAIRITTGIIEAYEAVMNKQETSHMSEAENGTRERIVVWECSTCGEVKRLRDGDQRPSCGGAGERMHKARHTAGQRVLDATGDLKLTQKLLGHASIQTTGDVYVDYDRAQFAAKLADVFRKEEEDGEDY